MEFTALPRPFSPIFDGLGILGSRCSDTYPLGSANTPGQKSYINACNRHYFANKVRSSNYTILQLQHWLSYNVLENMEFINLIRVNSPPWHFWIQFITMAMMNSSPWQWWIHHHDNIEFITMTILNLSPWQWRIHHYGNIEFIAMAMMNSSPWQDWIYHYDDF